MKGVRTVAEVLPLEVCKFCKHHTYCRPLLACRLDSPKSVMTQLKCSSTKTLPGFRSPCTTCKQQHQQWAPIPGLRNRRAALRSPLNSGAHQALVSISLRAKVQRCRLSSGFGTKLVSCLKENHNCNIIVAQPAAQQQGLWYRYSYACTQELQPVRHASGQSKHCQPALDQAHVAPHSTKAVPPALTCPLGRAWRYAMPRAMSSAIRSFSVRLSCGLCCSLVSKSASEPLL